MQIASLLVFESAVLTAIGMIVGLALEFAVFYFLSGWLERTFGFYFVGAAITYTEVIYLAIILISGILIGLIPAIKSARTALKDGLTIKV